MSQRTRSALAVPLATRSGSGAPVDPQLPIGPLPTYAITRRSDLSRNFACCTNVTLEKAFESSRPNLVHSCRKRMLHLISDL